MPDQLLSYIEVSIASVALLTISALRSLFLEVLQFSAQCTLFLDRSAVEVRVRFMDLNQFPITWRVHDPNLSNRIRVMVLHPRHVPNRRRSLDPGGCDNRDGFDYVPVFSYMTKLGLDFIHHYKFTSSQSQYSPSHFFMLCEMFLVFIVALLYHRHEDLSSAFSKK